MESLTEKTPQVLHDWLDLISSPAHDKYTSTIDKTQLTEHPDIRYFREIKTKNHFLYHKEKTNKHSVDEIQSKMTAFDPYNRERLLNRLSTFTVLNWSVPENLNFNALVCSLRGWECKSFSVTGGTRNCLECLTCHKQVVIKFNELDMGTTFDYDLDDYEEMNQRLANHYMSVIETSGHDSNCSWRSAVCSLEGTYYLRPFLDGTDSSLIDEYLKILNNLINNTMVLIQNSGTFNDELLTEESNENFMEFKRISNQWLLRRYFNDDLVSTLNSTPGWLYKLASLGWDLHIQSFANDLVVSTSHPPVRKGDESISSYVGVDLSSSKILTPCKYPKPFESEKSPFEDMNDEDAELCKLNIVEEHNLWCFYKKPMTSELSVQDYLINLIARSEDNIGPLGEYVRNDLDFMVDSPGSKRKHSFDINEGLEKLNKLRKLYLIDE